MTITSDQLLNRWYYKHIRHGNKGYPLDENGDVIMRPGGEEPFHLGFSWTYQALENPRVTYTHHIMHPDKEDTTVWAVDGEDVVDVEAALVALSRPPVLTLTEFWAWVRMGPVAPQAIAVDIIAGAANPTPNFIGSGTRWSIALRALDGLRCKGLITYHEPTDTYRRT